MDSGPRPSTDATFALLSTNLFSTVLRSDHTSEFRNCAAAGPHQFVKTFGGNTVRAVELGVPLSLTPQTASTKPIFSKLSEHSIALWSEGLAE